MGSTGTGAGSTKINTESTAANTSPTAANTESTVAEITSTQAITESTTASTTPNPVLSFEEALSSSSFVCIRNSKAGYLDTSVSMKDSNQRYLYISNVITPDSRWKLDSAQDGDNTHVYIIDTRNEIWFSSTDEKETFKKGNEDSFATCRSTTNILSDKICSNFATFPYAWIPGDKTPERIFEIIPASDKLYQIRSIYDNRLQYASDDDVTSVIADSDSPDENLLWSFERCG